ncbi:MAG: hypothetical protein Q4B26_02255 [Eubacteriales bacterium]|nr:hypothetical protein [Eubacteriales bacterium]
MLENNLRRQTKNLAEAYAALTENGFICSIGDFLLLRKEAARELAEATTEEVLPTQPVKRADVRRATVSTKKKQVEQNKVRKKEEVNQLDRDFEGLEQEERSEQINGFAILKSIKDEWN